MKKFCLILTAALLLAACGQSYEETKRLTRQQRHEAWQRDSAALKIAVMPTLDCLPLFVAREERLLDTIYGGVRLKHYTAQMDCDTALTRHRVEGMVSDLVRTRRVERQGLKLRYMAQTGAYWQLVANRNARIHQLKQLDGKMVAMTRYSVTDMLTDRVADSAALRRERVFKVQVNDVAVRMLMLRNNEMDALWLAEPQATEARLMKNPVLCDSRTMGLQPGVIAFNETEMRHPGRAKQLSLLQDAYDKACDLINQRGLSHYRDLIVRCCQVRPEAVDSLPPITFQHARGPRQEDLAAVDRWLGVKPAKGDSAKKGRKGAKAAKGRRGRRGRQ